MHAIDIGDATLMVGCNSQEAFDRVLPILRAMAKYTFHMGELGAGHAMKTLNNYIMASGYTALADSLVVGQKFGLDPIQMIDVLNVGTGSNFPAKDTFKNDALPRTYASGFQLALLIKDLGITKELMENVGFRTLLPGLIQEGLKHAMGKVSGPDADHTEGSKGWEDRAGIKLRTGRPEGKTVTAIKMVSQRCGQYDEQRAVPMHAFVTVKPGTHVKWYVHVIEEKDGKFEASIKEQMTGLNI